MKINQKAIALVTSQATKITIKNDSQLEQASEIRTNLKAQLRKLTDEKEKVTKPLNEALKAERARFKPFEDQIEIALRTIDRAMITYQTEAKRLADLEMQKIENRIGEGKGKITLETAVAKMNEVQTPEKLIITKSGGTKFRTEKKFEVVDLKKVPIDYHLPNEVLIRKAMKEGVELPGVKYWEEQIPVNA